MNRKYQIDDENEYDLHYPDRSCNPYVMLVRAPAWTKNRDSELEQMRDACLEAMYQARNGNQHVLYGKLRRVVLDWKELLDVECMIHRCSLEDLIGSETGPLGEIYKVACEIISERRRVDGDKNEIEFE